MSDPNHKPGRKRYPREPSTSVALERSVAFLGLVLVLGSLGFLFYEGLWGEHSPPDVIVETQQIADNGNGFLVRFVARNGGGETAASVKIIGTLRRDGKQIETADVMVDYVPSGSKVEGGLYFSNDPGNGDLVVRATGYQKP